MLVDEATVHVRGGKGGDGCSSFEYTLSRKKRPNGGDGGKGGDVYFIANKNLYSLLDFQHRTHIKASDGRRGSSANKTGKSGKIIKVDVPCGTVIRDSKTEETIADLTDDKQEVLVCRGGRGGRGNYNFPVAQKGEEGQEREVLLELKYLCDVGLVGFPNSGKSTLINSLCAVHSRVGMYPFTTKNPVLGIKVFKREKIVFSDIPGLIENAHLGKGLGITFLKHVERSKVLIFLLDPSFLQELSLQEQLETLQTEIREYKAALMERPQIIAINKTDLEESKGAIEEFLKSRKRGVCLISALEKKGLDNLLNKVYKIIKIIRKDEESSS